MRSSLGSPGFARINRRWLSLLLVAASAGFALVALADAPVLHEYIEPDAAEDLELGATTPDGRMPAAVRTPSGVIRAPGFADLNLPRQTAYGGGATPDSIDATFRLDRDTSEPSAVRYDDPFTPSVTPFKRQYAFDAVDAELALGVHDKTLSALPIGGSLASGDDHFFGDLFVDVGENVPVRIPSVGPGSRLLALRAEPPTELQVRRDSAENWYIVAAGRQRIRLILEIAAPRAGFGSEFADASYAELARWLRPLPPAARPAVQTVLARLSLSQSVRPREAVATLVAYFRSFAASGDLPKAPSGAPLYLELSLEKKGVCRHRAYGFMLTALGLGIPTRFVRNEAHAWVEVGDGRLWHRIDLGGAAQRFDADTRPGAPAHVAPPDPYVWPEGANSAQSNAQSSGEQPSAGPANSAQPANSSRPAPQTALSAHPPAIAPAASSAPATTPTTVDATPHSQVDWTIAGEARRGAAVRVQGRVTSSGEACPLARVDIVLAAPAGDVWIGSVPTDASGKFDSQITIPFDIEVGDHVLRASTPGAGACGASR